jgi:Leucine-rich repeat (LRR) protein
LFKKCINLRYLDCSHNNLTTLDGLENCNNLIDIDCYNNNILTLDNLKKCRKLKTVEHNDHFRNNVNKLFLTLTRMDTFELLRRLNSEYNPAKLIV